MESRYLSSFDHERLAGTVNILLDWFVLAARSLPWREDPSPYHVWISEIMLQQTRVEAVKPYYRRFVDRLPDIAALASCPDEKLLKLWEGLGYYSRARNLKKTAQIVMQQYGGELPGDYHKLLDLPGIGPYTAGAIASIAFSLPVPAVDGNVLRVMSRICASREDILLPAVKKDLEKTLAGVIPKDRPGTYNQALMELGALICLPNKAPDCENCPVKEDCLSCRDALTDEIPVRSAKAARKIEERTVMIIRDALHLVLARRPARGLLAGMYELPSLPGKCTEGEVLAAVKKRGINPVRIKPLPEAKHIFTHIEWHMSAYLILAEDMEDLTIAAGGDRTEGREGSQEETDGTGWFAAGTEQTKERYPVPSAFKAYAPLMDMEIGNAVFGKQ